MTRIALIVAYLISAAATVILLNASSENSGVAILIWMVASMVLGGGTGQPGFALLAFLAIPFAIPFGYPDHYQYSDLLFPIGMYAAQYAVISAVLIFLTALARRFIGAHRRQRASL